VKKSYLESEKRKAIEASAAAQVERVKGGESMAAVAKALGAKLERAEGLKRGATPPGFTPIAFGEIFALKKGGVSSSASADGKSRTIYRVAEVTPAGAPTKEQITALGADLTKQLRIDALEQYVAGLRTHYGFTVNEKALAQAMGPQSTAPVEPAEVDE